MNKLPRDQWGRPLAFSCVAAPGEDGDARVEVDSAGKGGRFGTADDVRSRDL